MWNFIAKIGIELEGGWDSTPPTRVHSDGSVNVRAGATRGEVSSAPLSENGWRNWVTANQPQHANISCGLHVHMSFGSLMSYMTLMDEAFHSHLVERLTAWGEAHHRELPEAFFERIAGRNEYCRNDGTARLMEAQAAATYKGSERYAHINFCYRLHGTVEFRVLPGVNKAALSIAMIAALIEIVESWVAQQTGATIADGAVEATAGGWALMRRTIAGPAQVEEVISRSPSRPTVFTRARRIGVSQPSSLRWTRGAIGDIYEYRLRAEQPTATGRGAASNVPVELVVASATAEVEVIEGLEAAGF
jgi:hypothetical protein